MAMLSPPGIGRAEIVRGMTLQVESSTRPANNNEPAFHAGVTRVN